MDNDEHAEAVEEAKRTGLYHACVKDWQSWLGRRDKGRKSLTKSIRAKMTAQRRWQLRRQRYGPEGRKPVDRRLPSRLEGNPPGAWSQNNNDQETKTT